MCKRTMYKRARIPMFLWERRACANSGAQAVFPRPRKNGLGTRLHRSVLANGCGFTQRSPDHLSNQIDNNPYVVHIIRLARSSSTRFEGDLASGKSRRALPMAPPTILT